MSILCLLGFHKYTNIHNSEIWIKQITPNGVVDIPVMDRLCTNCGKLDDKASRIKKELDAEIEEEIEEEQERILFLVRNNQI